MAIDHRPRLGRQREPDRREPLVESGLELGRELGKALNARRERITRTVQALLLSVVPRAVRAPLPASFRRTAGRSSVFRGRSGSRPGLPVPLASPVTRVTSVRMPDVSRRPSGRQRGYPRIHVGAGRLWITDRPTTKGSAVDGGSRGGRDRPAVFARRSRHPIRRSSPASDEGVPVRLGEHPEHGPFLEALLLAAERPLQRRGDGRAAAHVGRRGAATRGAGGAPGALGLTTASVIHNLGGTGWIRG